MTTVILGAKRVEQLSENVQATSIQLSDDDLAQLDAASKLPVEYPGWLLDRPGDQRS